MHRKSFIELAGLGTAVFLTPANTFAIHKQPGRKSITEANELRADLVIAGCGVGGCAAALAALRNNLSVIVTE